jgi:hypothetical protein
MLLEGLGDKRAYVWKEEFAVVKSKETFSNAFAVIQDKREITVIIEKDKLSLDKVIDLEEGWRLITFDMELPFELVGFLSKIAAALADGGIPFLTVSSYSTYHILVKESELQKTIDKLSELGFIIKR